MKPKTIQHSKPDTLIKVRAGQRLARMAVKLATGAAVFTCICTASAVAGPREQLEKLFRPHAYTGQPITKAMRAATGDPNIQVIDRRWEFGEIYTCSYIFIRQKRVIICD